MDNPEHDEDGTTAEAAGGAPCAAVSATAASAVGEDRPQRRGRVAAVARQARKGGAEAAITAQRLREVLHYDPETGIFTWKIAPRSKPEFIGTAAGSNHGEGYKIVKIAQRTYLAHRLAWLYVHGVWPSFNIDHRNGNRADNRIANLRDASQSINLQNQRGPRSHNKTGFLGVKPARNGRFAAQIVLNGKPVHLGIFKTAEEAHAVYVAAKRKHHPGCTI